MVRSLEQMFVRFFLFYLVQSMREFEERVIMEKCQRRWIRDKLDQFWVVKK